MKHGFYIAAAALLCVLFSCDKQDEEAVNYGRKDEDDSGRGPQVETPEDSVVKTKIVDTYFCLVKAPSDYDWKQDSLCGNFKGQISFHKNSTKLYSLDAGCGTDIPAAPSMHHILDGHLYLECADCVMKDKDVFYTVDSKEVLSSMLLSGGKVYTLSSVSSGGFCLRCDGSVSIKNNSGVVHPLYEDQGKVCFTYWVNDDGVRQLHLVSDGQDTPLDTDPSVSFLDARYYNGDIYTLYTSNMHYWISSPSKAVKHNWTDERTTYEDGELVPFGGGLGARVQRAFEEDYGLERIFLTGKGGVILYPSSRNESLLTDGANSMAQLSWDKDGQLSVIYKDSLSFSYNSVSYLGDQNFFSDDYLFFGGSQNGSPFVWKNGTLTKMDGNGYVSAASATVSYQ